MTFTRSWTLALAFCLALASPAAAQQGDLVPPAQGASAKSVLQQIQERINSVQTMQADLEYDEKEKPSKKKKKKEGAAAKPAGINPKWPEPEGRNVERGPIMIKREKGAYLMLQRKTKATEYIANNQRLWKYDHKDKEAKFVPSSWPIVNTFVNNALVMNAMVAMDSDGIKYRGTQVVEGEPCWVLDGKTPSRLGMVGAKPVRLKMWVSQTDGIPRLIHMPGKEDTYIRLKNVKINNLVEENRFSFSPPSGVKQKNIFGF